MAFTNAVAGILTICLSVCASFYFCSALFLVCFVLWNYCKTNRSAVSLSLIYSFHAFLWLCIWILGANGFFPLRLSASAKRTSSCFPLCNLAGFFPNLLPSSLCARKCVLGDAAKVYPSIYAMEIRASALDLLLFNQIQHNTTQHNAMQYDKAQHAYTHFTFRSCWQKVAPTIYHSLWFIIFCNWHSWNDKWVNVYGNGDERVVRHLECEYICTVKIAKHNARFKMLVKINLNRFE